VANRRRFERPVAASGGSPTSISASSDITTLRCVLVWKRDGVLTQTSTVSCLAAAAPDASPSGMIFSCVAARASFDLCRRRIRDDTCAIAHFNRIPVLVLGLSVPTLAQTQRYGTKSLTDPTVPAEKQAS
jgi:hypothetical protein